jgi:hypothetical protein
VIFKKLSAADSGFSPKFHAASDPGRKCDLGLSKLVCGQREAGFRLGEIGGGGLFRRLRSDRRPVSGFSSVFSQFTARISYSRRPQTSQIQAGKFGTVTSSSFNQVK